MLTDAVRDRASVDHLQGPVQPALAAAARRRRPLVEPVHRDHAEHQSDDEIAVCNLGSVNLLAHVTDGGLDHGRLKQTVTTAMRMLDNVIDINFYTVPKARRSNLRHRPVGLGSWASRTRCYALRIPYASEAAVAFADSRWRRSATTPISASIELAGERGRYATYEGSLWSRGILPLDTLDLLADSARRRRRRRPLGARWTGTRCANASDGTACATPTAWRSRRPRRSPTSSASRSRSSRPTEPLREVEPVGRVHRRQRVPGARPQGARPVGRGDGQRPQVLRRLARPDRPRPGRPQGSSTRPRSRSSRWLVEAAARRQKWIDQAQSLNLYMAQPPPARSSTSSTGWPGCAGLKTTYYLRTRSATHVEKSTLEGHRWQAQCRRLDPVDVGDSRLVRRGCLCDRQSRLRSLPVSDKRRNSRHARLVRTPPRPPAVCHRP